MSRYALINPQNQIDRIQSNVDPNVQTKSGWKWVIVNTNPQPTFDPATETIEGPSRVIGDNAVTETWTKRSLTAQEISDRKDNAIASIGSDLYPVVFEALFNLNNRVRVLEGQSTVTRIQFRNALKSLL